MKKWQIEVLFNNRFMFSHAVITPKFYVWPRITVDAYPIDARAFYRLVMLLAESQTSLIREDETGSQMTIEQYRRKYAHVLKTSYADLMRPGVEHFSILNLDTEEPAIEAHMEFS